MKKTLIIAILIGLNFAVTSQILVPKKDYDPEVRQARYSFTLSLVSGGYNTPVSFGIMRQLPDSSKEVIYLGINNFILQIQAFQKSKANPDKINYLKEYDISPAVINDLWKIKYDLNPYSVREEKGWASGKGTPSPGQFAMLAEFGIRKMSDYCYGDNLIKLLLKANDPVWVNQYQNR